MISGSDIRRWVTCAVFRSTGSRSIQSFVRCPSDDLVGRAIVRAVVGIGQSLGMATVAEGIETEEQLARIVAEGCTEAQGFLISRPMPPEQIGDYLLAQKDGVRHQT
jgi:EAL domain-containing protein (putative c-di-GMP-specific phosphodiesterase class I)